MMLMDQHAVFSFNTCNIHEMAYTHKQYKQHRQSITETLIHP